jgi:hypothetical protein
VNAKLAHPAKLISVKNGRQAGFETVKLMHRSIDELPPHEIIDVFQGNPGAGRTKAMWDALGERTIARMADGAHVLASIWQGAWEAGGGESLAGSKLGAVSKTTLRAIYDSAGFAPSVYLHMMKTQGDELTIVANGHDQ